MEISYYDYISIIYDYDYDYNYRIVVIDYNRFGLCNDVYSKSDRNWMSSSEVWFIRLLVFFIGNPPPQKRACDR